MFENYEHVLGATLKRNTRAKTHVNLQDQRTGLDFLILILV